MGYPSVAPTCGYIGDLGRHYCLQRGVVVQPPRLKNEANAEVPKNCSLPSGHLSLVSKQSQSPFTPMLKY